MTFNWVHGAFATGGVLVGLATTGLVGLSGNALGVYSEEGDDVEVEAPEEEDLAELDLTDATYEVEVDGLIIANDDFLSVTEVAPEGQQQDPGGDEGPDEEISGPTEIVVERKFHGIDDLYVWRTDVEHGNIERHNITITVLDGEHRPVEQLELREAWPRVWETPDISLHDEVDDTETITLMVEDMRRRRL